MEVGEDKSRQDEHKCAVDEILEINVISPADAISNPRTMMVKFLDAIIANRAVFGTRRAVNLASPAPLVLDTVDFLDKLSLAFFEADIRVREDTWNHARIHGSGHHEVVNHNEVEKEGGPTPDGAAWHLSLEYL